MKPRSRRWRTPESKYRCRPGARPVAAATQIKSSGRSCRRVFCCGLVLSSSNRRKISLGEDQMKKDRDGRHYWHGVDACRVRQGSGARGSQGRSRCSRSGRSAGRARRPGRAGAQGQAGRSRRVWRSGTAGGAGPGRGAGASWSSGAGWPPRATRTARRSRSQGRYRTQGRRRTVRRRPIGTERRRCELRGERSPGRGISPQWWRTRWSEMRNDPNCRPVPEVRRRLAVTR